ncbi:MAG: hypothetical protein JXK94_12100 [Deltaproteobacteria bacterium]|nr:hypothetical protein [Deltaproteobacteria bacterium]
MINRAAVILRYKSPAIQWINEADPHDDEPAISLESANEDGIVYLIMDGDADTPELLDEWIKLNYQTLLKNELAGWYTDKSLWPKKLDLDLFHEWFDIECHSIVEDTVDLPIEDE